MTRLFCPISPLHVSTSVSYHVLLTGSVFLTLSLLLAALFISVTFFSSPAVKMEKMHLKVDSAKLVQTPSAPVTTSFYSSNTTVSFNTAPIATSSSSLSSSALKPGLNCSSIPKPPLPAPGQIPYGKILLADKKQDSSSSASSRRHCNKKVSGQTNWFLFMLTALCCVKCFVPSTYFRFHIIVLYFNVLCIT